MKLRWLWCLFLLVVPVQALPEQARGEMPSRNTREPQLLRGTNVIRTDQGSMLRVRLPRDVTLRYQPKELFSKGGLIDVKGGGRIAGVVLTPDALRSTADLPFVALQVRECLEPGCQDGTVMKAAHPYGFNVTRRLPAGLYRLYVLVDHAKTRITLKLPGLVGDSVLRTEKPVALDIATPASTVSHSGEATIYEGSHVSRFESNRGLAFSGTWLRGNHYRGSRVNWCFAPNLVPTPGPTRTALACVSPLGAKGSFEDEVTPADERQGRFFFFTMIALGPQQLGGDGVGNSTDWTYGLSAISPGPVKSVGSHIMTLSF